LQDRSQLTRWGGFGRSGTPASAVHELAPTHF
jgi:hypothetical protein